MKKLIVVLISSLASVFLTNAQENSLTKNYLGSIPSILLEPYDTINAVEINFFPFLYEARTGKNNGIGLQVRPIINYRFFQDKSGFSQLGATIVMNKYFLNLFDDDFWIKPQLGTYCTYAFNRLDTIQTITLGIEPGAYMHWGGPFSLSINLQPGLNYYPDEFSREFVETESGFKSHFGFIFHLGYNF